MTAKQQSIIEAALVGFQLQRKRLMSQIAELRAMLKPTNAQRSTRPKRTISSAARQRMAAAQRRRWKEFRKKNGL